MASRYHLLHSAALAAVPVAATTNDPSSVNGGVAGLHTLLIRPPFLAVAKLLAVGSWIKNKVCERQHAILGPQL